MTEFTSTCPLTGQECDARAIIIARRLAHSDFITEHSGTKDEAIRRVMFEAERVIEIADRLLAPVDCSSTCSAMSKAIGFMLNVERF